MGSLSNDDNHVRDATLNEHIPTASGKKFECHKEDNNDKNKHLSDSIEITETIPGSHDEMKEIQILDQIEKEMLSKHFGVRIDVYDIVNPIKYFKNYETYIMILNDVTPNAGIDLIKGDGNCFFRAISKQLLNSERFHYTLRLVICNFMETFKEVFQKWSVENINTHIAKMRKNRVWATEIEILAVATYFDIKIFEFTACFPLGGEWKWITISPIKEKNVNLSQFPITSGYIYLHHTNGNHFDVVYPLTQ